MTSALSPDCAADKNARPADSVLENKRAIRDACARRITRVQSVPYYYHVHLNKPCNQRCIMCKPDGDHGKDVLTFEQFQAFFARVKPFAEHLTLIGGEPLLYPWINEVLELLAREPIAVSINTNVTMLHGPVTDRLLSLHELYLRCSIDAATRSMYREIRGTDLFDRVLANLGRFAEAAATRQRIHVLLVYVVMRRNLAEVLPFVELARRFRPLRVEFHPVRHVKGWQVTNKTGWHFNGDDQSCEAFRDEYNEVMSAAADRCRAEGLAHEVHLL